jgi:hypothetical protein
LLGTWRLTAASVKAAAATGLSESELRGEYLTLETGGRCTGDILAAYCGYFGPAWQTRGKMCRWKVDGTGSHRNTLNLTIGEGPETFAFDLYLIDRGGLMVWDYLCDPDGGEFVDFVRSDRLQ